MLRFATSIRDHLSPWLVVAIGSIALLPLVLTAGCDIACALGAMPGGACTHTGMSHAHGGHVSGELVSVLPFIQTALAALALAVAMIALVSIGSAPPAPVRVEVVREEREGTRLRI